MQALGSHQACPCSASSYLTQEVTALPVSTPPRAHRFHFSPGEASPTDLTPPRWGLGPGWRVFLWQMDWTPRPGTETAPGEGDAGVTPAPTRDPPGSPQSCEVAPQHLTRHSMY